MPDCVSDVEPVSKQREQKSKEEPFGTVYEAGRETRFVSSPSGTVHERPPLKNDEGFSLDPVCGQVLPGDSVWGSIDAETAEEVATVYGMTQFCTKCFNRTLHLAELGRKARNEA